MGSPLHCPLSCPLFSHLQVVDCPLSCPLFPYMEVVGSLICMAKFPWAAHGQPTPLPTELPTASIYGSSGQPTELPTVSIYGSSGQPNLHGKIPMGSPLRCPVQPIGSEVGSSPVFFSYGKGSLKYRAYPDTGTGMSVDVFNFLAIRGSISDGGVPEIKPGSPDQQPSPLPLRHPAG